jgi:hypothetical protein
MSMNCGPLDREFSLLVRRKADWSCARCGKCLEDRPGELHCSHFHGRRHKSVRFDFDNCDAFCWECHGYFDQHPAEHASWKLAELGAERFEALQARARQIAKIDLKQVRAFINEIKKQKS